MTDPKVSVMLPVFNRQQYIGAAIESILNQSFSDFKLLIYNDGSTDRTEEIIQEYAKKDDRITPVYRVDDQDAQIPAVNKGVAFARNILLASCETPIACYQDSDDLSHPQRLQNQLKWAQPGEMIFTSWEWFKDAPVKNYWDKVETYNKNQRAYASVMFYIDRKIRYNENIVLGGEDTDWLERMLLTRKQVILPELLYFIRNHEDRIGIWKSKIQSSFAPHELAGVSYADAITMYKNKRGG
jgi:glycosyltransferase involved in cell wall biosynthesis